MLRDRGGWRKMEAGHFHLPQPAPIYFHLSSAEEHAPKTFTPNLHPQFYLRKFSTKHFLARIRLHVLGWFEATH